MTSDNKIPTRHRPIFDGLATIEEKMAAAMIEYDDMKEAGEEDGLDFSNKTSMWIAFERWLESERPDRLFNDPLAQHLHDPYGQRLSDAMSLGLSFSVFDDMEGSIGFGLEGHVMYTAARTKLINDYLAEWIAKYADCELGCQVVNLGAGLDTRQYWLECLKKAKVYWEVDTASVMEYKEKTLGRLKINGNLPDVLVQTKSIAIDFSKESLTELTSSRYQFDSTIPTGWILEGLVMYLKKSAVEELFENLSALSASHSYLILNFSTNTSAQGPDACPSIESISEQLAGHGWKKDAHLMFGQEGFNFNRYPEGKPANKILGFAMYVKE